MGSLEKSLQVVTWAIVALSLLVSLLSEITGLPCLLFRV